jgi:N-acetyl-anhydromuramyl-L-alanine amidase AmpD
MLRTIDMSSRKRIQVTAALSLLAVLIILCSVAVPCWRLWLHHEYGPLDGKYRFIASPHHGARPLFTGVDCVVLHSTASDTFASTVGKFRNPKSRVSAHFVVDKDGTVVQMVRIEDRAWHAGSSVLDDRPNVNDYSVGIEMVNRNDGVDPYTIAQYRSVAGIIRLLRTKCDIPTARIVSHAQIARPYGRKTDPRAFNWVRLRRML